MVRTADCSIGRAVTPGTVPAWPPGSSASPSPCSCSSPSRWGCGRPSPPGRSPTPSRAAAAAPRRAYDDSAGGGRRWVAVDGPYNEHLVRDFGSLNLALAAVTIVAAVTLARAVVIAAALAWLLYGIPHLVYPPRHIDVYDSGDKAA